MAGLDAWDAEDSLDELARLVETAGGTDHGPDHPAARSSRIRPPSSGVARRPRSPSRGPSPGFDLLVVDSALSPVQQRNLEKRIDGPVLDRPGLIIEIFGQRARTSEARLQVELARLEYLLPRLAGAWTHLERQVGGIGARGGPGERQIELDRRLVRNRIAALKREIDPGPRPPRRSGPAARACGTPLVALVGYTNAGQVQPDEPADRGRRRWPRTSCSPRSIRRPGGCGCPAADAP